MPFNSIAYEPVRVSHFDQMSVHSMGVYKIQKVANFGTFIAYRNGDINLRKSLLGRRLRRDKKE